MGRLTLMMMKASYFRLITVAMSVSCFATAPASAETIISQGGTNNTFYSMNSLNDGLSVGWTMTTGFSNVDVTASLTSQTSEPVTAFLTTAIGREETPNDLIATTAVNIIGSSNYDLFSNLTLGAGTYYLTIAYLGGGDSLSQFGWNIIYTPFEVPTIITAPGVSYDGDNALVLLNASNPPASGFGFNSDFGPVFEVTSTATATPEPGAVRLLLLPAGLCILLWLCKNLKALRPR